MTNPSPDLIRQVEAESVDTDEFRKLAMAWSDAATECWPSKTFDGWNAMIAHIENYVAARATAERKEGYESQLPRIRHLEHERDIARSAASMAECMDMVRGDLIEAGIIDKSVAPMFIPEAVIGFIQRDRAALAASQAAPAKAEGWISVKDRQPEWAARDDTPCIVEGRPVPPTLTSQMVLVALDGGAVRVDKLVAIEGGKPWFDTYRNRVTHWRVIPAQSSTPAKEPT